MGLRARRTFADPKGTAQGVGLLISSSENSVVAKFAEIVNGEVRRIPLPRTPVNRARRSTEALPRGSKRSRVGKRDTSISNPPLSAWCELPVEDLSGRCPPFRVGLLAN